MADGCALPYPYKLGRCEVDSSQSKHMRSVLVLWQQTQCLDILVDEGVMIVRL